MQQCLEKSGVKKECHGGARKGAGRKPFKAKKTERELVARLIGLGVPVEQIGSLVGDGISETTLRNHFSSEILKGQALANSKIAESLFEQAMSGNVTAQIWWTKARMGWREQPQQVEVSNNVERFLADVEAMKANLMGEEPW
ncbi:MAG: hypothetical protein H7829_01845 [Magnetococcus sp. THC-1_WYH]